MAAKKADTRPQTVDFVHYGGDTLTFTVTAPAALVAGMVWNGQVRADRKAGTPVDAIFEITPPVAPDGPAFVVLSAVDTARLVATNPTYKGVWDCQISDPTNPDPVKTLVQGTLTISTDVTRLP